MTNEIIIIGANSFAARTILPHLLEQYDKVHLVCRNKHDFDIHSKIQVHVTDNLASASIKNALHNCKFGIYLASATTPASSATTPLVELESNLEPLLTFLESLQNKDDFTLIYTSSGGTVYGNATTGPATETQHFSPRSYHAAAKIAGESFVHAFSRQTGNLAIILRPSNFYGVGQPFRENFGVIRAIFECVLKNKPVTIWGDGESQRDFIYIEDFVSACTFLLQKNHTEKVQTFNVASGESVSINHLCNLIEKVTGRKLEKIYNPMRQVDVRTVKLDSSKLQELGWAPETSIEHGLKLMWDWIKK